MNVFPRPCMHSLANVCIRSPMYVFHFYSFSPPFFSSYPYPSFPPYSSFHFQQFLLLIPQLTTPYVIPTTSSLPNTLSIVTFSQLPLPTLRLSSLPFPFPSLSLPPYPLFFPSFRLPPLNFSSLPFLSHHFPLPSSPFPFLFHP